MSMYNLPAYVAPKASDSSIMVLLVDDQAMVGEAVRRALEPETDIDFHFCSDPSKVISLAEQIRPSVILQDLLMPGIDGIELLEQMRRNPALGDVPIIMLSTRDDPVIKSSAFAAGANDYLVKLPDVVELVARIRYHSRSYLALLQRDEAYRALRESQQQLLEANLTLQHLMHSDGLTGLSNRRHFDEYLEMEWRRAAREQSGLSILMIDVDHFKAYNDHLGHLAGDDALRAVAACIKANCSRASDMAARFGGEEFVMILPGTPLAGAEKVAQKLRQDVMDLALSHPKSALGQIITISIGVGYAEPGSAHTAMELVKRADTALYQAKGDGRNRVVAASE